LTAFTGVDSQNLADVMVSVQFILAIGEIKNTCFLAKLQINLRKTAFFSKKLSKLTYVNFFIKNSSTICFEHWKALLEKKVNV
jgi:hypothetical protein